MALYFEFCSCGDANDSDVIIRSTCRCRIENRTKPVGSGYTDSLMGGTPGTPFGVTAVAGPCVTLGPMAAKHLKY